MDSQIITKYHVVSLKIEKVCVCVCVCVLLPLWYAEPPITGRNVTAAIATLISVIIVVITIVIHG